MFKYKSFFFKKRKRNFKKAFFKELKNWQEFFKKQKWKNFNNKDKWCKYHNTDTYNTQNCYAKHIKDKKSDKVDKLKKINQNIANYNYFKNQNNIINSLTDLQCWSLKFHWFHQSKSFNQFKNRVKFYQSDLNYSTWFISF